jgi:hypothetical protein
VLLVISVLSSGLVPAGNCIIDQFTNCRKLTPPARFILPGAVFHRDRLPLIEPKALLNKRGWQLYLFCNKNLMIKLNFLQKNRAEHGTGISEEKQTLLSKR